MMLSFDEKDLYSLLVELVSIPGISMSREENRTAEFIHSRLSELEYFQKNPDHLRFLPVKGDSLERKAVAALVKTGRSTKKTIIVTGHFDVVDASAYGPLKHLAFSPEELSKRVGELEISDEARADLASGDYLFGRGVSDMKAGIALEMCLLGEVSRETDFPCNVLFLAVPDEENTSAGMRGALPWLLKLQKEWELKLSACLNGEPSVGSRGVPAGAVYLGTIGKIMPFYLCVGREAHVGDYYEGISSALIIANIVKTVEGVAETSEILDGVSFPPMACLRFHDLVKNYSVTLPERAVAYYNLLTVSKTPRSILEDMKSVAMAALTETLGFLEKQRKTVEDRGGASFVRQKNEVKVLTYGELKTLTRKRMSGFDGRLEGFLAALPSHLDERERCVETASFLLDLSGEKGPLVVVGFLPPYYPPRRNLRENPGELAVLRAVDRLKEAGNEYGLSISTVEVFQGIMDLSYFGFQGEGAELDPLGANMPLWEVEYRFPLEELKKIDVPVANFGPVGKDNHKSGERIFLPYYLKVLPDLFRRFVAFLGEEAEGYEDEGADLS
ncbi:MAG: M20/M25/M40 family metallo-hydrolase [Synergistaceae bacterium]|nr:M20/M25/M40 family metallo-hydrolase [Synergistaceae bacterium]